MSQGGYQPPPEQGYYQPPPPQQGYYQPPPQPGYQQVPQQPGGYPPQDIEANKPPPYTSTYVYGGAPPPPHANYNETDSMLPPDDDPGISSFSEKSVRQGLLLDFLLINVNQSLKSTIQHLQIARSSCFFVHLVILLFIFCKFTFVSKFIFLLLLFFFL